MADRSIRSLESGRCLMLIGHNFCDPRGVVWGSDYYIEL